MEKTTLFRFTGRACDRYANRIGLTFEMEPGAIAAKLSLEQGMAVVRFDPIQTTIDEIPGSKIFERDLVIKWKDGRKTAHGYGATPLAKKPRPRGPV
ncbi:MAG: hypothetical protein QW767_06370 [Thermoprotei archaeon]